MAIEGLLLWGGYFKTEKTLAENARVKRFTALMDGREVGTIEIADPIGGAAFADAKRWPPVYLAEDFNSAPKKVKRLRLRIDAVHPGARYVDLCAPWLPPRKLIPSPA